MTSKLAVAPLSTILLFASLHAASVLHNDGCQCLAIHSEPLNPKDIKELIINWSGSDTPCENTEIIVTLKDESKVCLDFREDWVKKVVQIILERDGENEP